MRFIETEMRSQKILDFINYFNGSVDKRRIDKTKSRAGKLDLAMAIYNSDQLEIDKVREINSLFRNAEAFKKTYSDLERFDDDEFLGEYVEIIRQIEEFYRTREQHGLVGISKELHKLEEYGYFEEYSGSCQTVEHYINYNESPYLNDFLKEYGMTEHSFLRSVEVVSKLAEGLFDKYTEKYLQNRELRRMMTVDKIENLYTGISTGTTKDGEDFDEIEAFIYLPFYDETSSRETLGDFNLKGSATLAQKYKTVFEALMPEKANEIIRYIFDNDLIGRTGQNLLTEKEINDTIIIYKGITMTDEDKKAIVDYMKERKVPMFVKAFNEVRRAYYDGTLEEKKGKILGKRGNE